SRATETDSGPRCQQGELMFLCPRENPRHQHLGVFVFSQPQLKCRGKELCIRGVERFARVRGGGRLGYSVAREIGSAEKTGVEAGKPERFYRGGRGPPKAGGVEERQPGSEMLLDARHVATPEVRDYVDIMSHCETCGTALAADEVERL